MGKLIGLIIVVALGYGYITNKTKVHEFIGWGDEKLPETQKNIEAVTNEYKTEDGKAINYVKLDNFDILNVGIHLMSSSSCGDCAKLRNLMIEQDIPFTEYNAEADPVVKRFLKQKNLGGGVLVTVIGGDVVSGYDVDKLEKTFKENRVVISGI